jgi:hypothetical protein
MLCQDSKFATLQNFPPLAYKKFTQTGFLLPNLLIYSPWNSTHPIAIHRQTYYNLPMSIEKHFDIPFISTLALQVKQNQQNYRPIIAVHKWFERQPGTLLRGLILSEFSEEPLQETSDKSNNLKGIKIAHPFIAVSRRNLVHSFISGTSGFSFDSEWNKVLTV